MDDTDRLMRRLRVEQDLAAVHVGDDVERGLVEEEIGAGYTQRLFDPALPSLPMRSVGSSRERAGIEQWLPAETLGHCMTVELRRSPRGPLHSLAEIVGAVDL